MENVVLTLLELVRSSLSSSSLQIACVNNSLFLSLSPPLASLCALSLSIGYWGSGPLRFYGPACPGDDDAGTGAVELPGGTWWWGSVTPYHLVTPSYLITWSYHITPSYHTFLSHHIKLSHQVITSHHLLTSHQVITITPHHTNSSHHLIISSYHTAPSCHTTYITSDLTIFTTSDHFLTPHYCLISSPLLFILLTTCCGCDYACWIGCVVVEQAR